MDLSLHNITKVEMTNIIRKKSGGDEVYIGCPEYEYDIRNIIFTDSDGNEIKVTLFGQHDEKGTLKAKKRLKRY